MVISLTLYGLYLIKMPFFNTFANKADPDQAALIELPDQGLLCLLIEIRSIFFVLCTHEKVYLYNYS